MRGSFWQKNSLITHILFELQPIIIISQVANFGDQSLVSALVFLLCNENLNSFLTRVWKLFKGGKYLREETILGNTVHI